MRTAQFFFLIVLFCAGGAMQTQAEETDQFTLPPTELQDVGPAASRRLFMTLEQIITQTNSEIQSYLSRAKKSHYAASQLALRLNGNYIADLVYKRTGPGYPRWLRSMPLSQYKERQPWRTIYWLAMSQSPLFIMGLAPTINMYGYHFGTDKLGHFFMQGHTYYSIYRYYLAHGKTVAQAHDAIVTYGQILEYTYLGILINGIYSNADLSANYAGWKFYMNLSHNVKIDGQTLAPILVLQGNKWEFSKHIDKNTLLKPYLSDHLNEALNPCRYSLMRSQIYRQVKNRCVNWIEHLGITEQIVTVKLNETSLWHGETYGHWLPKKDAITLNICF